MPGRGDDDGRVAGRERCADEATEQFDEVGIVLIELNGMGSMPKHRPIGNGTRVEGSATPRFGRT
jgi:hypothetical protein